MAQETELERLVVRLVGDASGYLSAIKQATTETQKAASEVRESAKKMEGFLDTIKGFADGAVKALTALGTGNWLKQAFGEWTTAEDTAIRLSAAISANGKSVQELLPIYQDFAAQIQQVTVYGDDAVLAWIRHAETIGLSGKAAMDATRQAIGLAAATGTSVEMALTMINSMRQGNVEIFRRVKEFRGLKTQEEIIAKAEQLIRSGMQQTTAVAKTASGQIKQLANAYGDFLEEIGKVVAQGITPFVQAAKQIVAWFQSLSSEIKTAITVAGMLVTVFLSLGPIIATVGFIISSALNPAVIIITAIVGAISGWVASLGGVEKAYEAIRDAALAFWEEVKPIAHTIQVIFTEAWNDIVATAVQAWDTIKAAAQSFWQWIGDKFTISWASIRASIIDALLAIEFGIRNMGQVASLAWTKMKLDALVFVESVKHSFLVVQPALIQRFVQIAIASFQAFIDFAINGFASIAEATARIPDLIREHGLGAAKAFLDELAQGQVKAAQGAIEKVRDKINELGPINIPPRQMGEVEKQLRKEFAAQAGVLKEGWEEFRRKRLEQIKALEGQEFVGPPEAIKEEAADLGLQVGQAMTKGVKGELQSLEAVLFGSVSAITRVRAYMDRFTNPTAPTVAGGLGGGGGVAAAQAIARQPNNQPLPAADVVGKQQVGLLQQIAALTKQVADNTKPDLAPAGIV